MEWLSLPLIIFVGVIFFVIKSVCIALQQEAYIVERFGRFHAVLNPGLKFLRAFDG